MDSYDAIGELPAIEYASRILYSLANGARLRQLVIQFPRADCNNECCIQVFLCGCLRDHVRTSSHVKGLSSAASAVQAIRILRHFRHKEQHDGGSYTYMKHCYDHDCNIIISHQDLLLGK